MRKNVLFAIGVLTLVAFVWVALRSELQRAPTPAPTTAPAAQPAPAAPAPAPPAPEPLPEGVLVG